VLGFAGVLQNMQGIGNQHRVEVVAQGRFTQTFVPATTEVEFEGMKDPGGTGNVAGQLAKALFQQVLVHQVSLSGFQRFFRLIASGVPSLTD
jgi:hypothetical protein